MSRRIAIITVLAGLAVSPYAVGAQDAQSRARRMTASWADAPIRDVLRAFAVYSGASIVPSASVGGSVTADINDQPWDVALQTILSVNGLVGIENEHGIIRVENLVDLDDREAIEPILTRSYRISYSRASEIREVVAALLSERGTATVVEASNALVVSDIARVQAQIAYLLR